MFKKLLIFGGLGFAAYKLFNVGQTALTAKDLVPTIAGVKWKGVAQGALNFELLVDIFNPNTGELNADFVFLEIYAAKQFIATAEKTGWNAVIKPKQTTHLSVPVKVVIVDAISLFLSDLGKEILKGRFPKKVQVKGYVRANDVTVPVDEEVTVIS